MNDLFQRITTKSLLCQMKKLGCLFFNNSLKIPDNYSDGIKKELAQIKKAQREFKKSQIYS